MLALSFVSGVFVGYKIKSLRVKYLQTKRDYLARKLVEAQKKVDVAMS
jgi:hypothetical protein